MGYLAIQILIFLILSIILGFLIGWWLKSLLFRAAAADDVALAHGGRASIVNDPKAQQTELEKLREEAVLARNTLAVRNTEIAELREEWANTWTQSHEAATLHTQSSADPTEPPDDLKMISGIGAKLEAALHEHGIRHFRQIAEFTPENVAWVNKHLRFKGRIERERWIEQARQLADGGDTEFSARYKAT